MYVTEKIISKFKTISIKKILCNNTLFHNLIHSSFFFLIAHAINNALDLKNYDKLTGP